MAKHITFSFDGKDYTLEFTRASVREMESQGFAASEIADKPMTTLPKLFAGAFLARHPSEKRERIEEIYRKMPDKKALVAALAELYAEPLRALLEDPEPDEGNISWTPSWNSAEI